MLANLSIKNVGIIEAVSIDFTEGLNILTGETGAGKTLIIGSIKMILGERISKDIIRKGADSASVDALFCLEDDSLINKIEELGVELDNELVISREISLNGRNICKVNGRTVTTLELKKIGSLLIDVHGQHDNQSLLDVKKHIELLDSYAQEELELVMNEYQKLYKKRNEIKEKIASLSGEPEEREKKIEFLRFQIDEIDAAELKVGEEEELNEKRKVLGNSEKIVGGLSKAYNLLEDSNESAKSKIQSAIKSISMISDIDAKYAELYKGLEDVYYTLEEYSRDIEQYNSEMEIDPRELEVIDERLDLIFNLKRKYGANIQEILNYRDRTANEYEELVNSRELVESLIKQCKEIEQTMRVKASEISAIRQKNAKIIEERLEEGIQDLEMKKARFKISVESSENASFKVNGTDNVEILFSSNLGEDLKPLAKVASGGEISRIMLVLKDVLADSDEVPTMIFDEIDVGISGKSAFAVAKKMKTIADKKQILSVTHLAPIAGAGNNNLFIEKVLENERTFTKVRTLNKEEVIMEVARIVSGDNITGSAIEHAKEIIM